MTVTDAARESVESTLELERVESHLNPPGSYDLADHPVPTGREEIWRFTPLKRLRGVLDGEASDAHLTWTTTLPEGVTLTEVSADQAIEIGELPPNDRPSALAAANAGGALLLDVPADAVVTEPIVLEGLRLLDDLLQHEVRVAALLGLDRVPGEVLHLALDRRAVRPPDRDPVLAHARHVASSLPALRHHGGPRERLFLVHVAGPATLADPRGRARRTGRCSASSRMPMHPAMSGLPRSR